MQNENGNNPMDHTSNLKNEISALIEHLRSDVSKIDDASAKALFEVSPGKNKTGFTKWLNLFPMIISFI